jgi:calcineurin-like phosphoesterase family protein
MARSIWVTADTHFGESEAVGLFGRPFSDARTMDEAMLDGINRRVGRRDVLVHLGDFCGPHPEGKAAQVAHATAVRHRIRCRRVELVRGNHDPDSRRFEGLFDRVDDLRSWRTDDRRRVNACHWPMRLWRGQFKGGMLLHGHAHGGLAMLGRSVDVGVDCWRFEPVPLEPLLAWLQRVPFEDPDSWPRLQRDRDPGALPDLSAPEVASWR